MILPDTLRPLPVFPTGDELAVSTSFDDFVAAGDVRKVLLGAGELPVEGLPAEDFDCFAGRADIPFPSRGGVGRADPAELRVPDLLVEAPVVHPAFEVLPPSRRAAPPKLRQAVDCEASYGRSKVSERWWVLGMGLAACAVLFSGTLVDFITREVMRRSHVESIALPKVAPRVAPATAEQGSEEETAPLAATAKPENE